MKSTTDLKQIVQKCLNPRHRVYVTGNTVVIHREDIGDGWGLCKLSMIISGSDFKPNWKLEIYDTEEEYVWKVLLDVNENGT